MSKPTLFSRRSLFMGAGVGLASLLLGARRLGKAIAGPTDEPHRFVSVYFNGAWDVLLGLDARDPARTYGAIQLGTELLAPEYREPVPVTLGGRPTLYGATMAALVRHADVTTLFRGINMNTVAHPTGKAYVNSFLSPRGSTVRGDSIGTAIAALHEDADVVLPNVSIGMPSANVSFGTDVTALTLGRAPEITSILRPQQAPGDAALEEALRAAQDASTSCVSPRYPGPRPADQLAASRARMRRLLLDDVSAAFDFSRADLAPLRTRFGFTATTPTTSPNDVGVTAAVASQLVRAGLSRSVTIRLLTSLDTHGPEWATQQPAQLTRGFSVLAALLDELREDDPDLSHTTVIAHSEFARTPGLNGRGGRDHWFANSMLVFGALRPGVFGATTEDNLGLTPIDFATGLPAAGGTQLMPEHVGATITAALGGDASRFRVAPIQSLLPGSP